MKLDALLSTIILVSFLVTILMAIASYAAYKLRESRRPRSTNEPAADQVPYFFERILADPPDGASDES
jgi:flagellar basal body-associated protein FliL